MKNESLAMSAKQFPIETIPSGVEHFFNETVTPKKMREGIPWKQGYFSFNGQKRIATVTDVKFVSDNILVVAHRAAAKLYLIELKNDAVNILDTIRLEFSIWGQKFFHPDLIVLHKGSIYMSEYSNRCCIVDIIDNKLIFNNVLQFGGPKSHGLCSKGNSVLFGSVKLGKIIKFDDIARQFSVIDTDVTERRIKTVGMDGNNFVLGLDKPIRRGGDSWFNLYEFIDNKLLELNSVKFVNTQIDGHISHKGFHFITMHDGDTKSGVIVILKVNNNEINIVRKIKCENFPHGLDICNDKLIYCCYENSSIISHPLKDFLVI